MLNKILLIILFFGATAYAQDDQWVVDGGLGVSNSAPSMKMLTVSLQEDAWGPLKQKFSVGGWLDSSTTNKSSALVSSQLGFEVNSNDIIGGVFSGPCILTSTDSLLGGYFQFMSDLHLGIQDRDNNYFGVFYRHISSAGLESPNIGRDVVGIEIKY